MDETELLVKLETLVAKHAPEVWEAHAQRAIVDVVSDFWVALAFGAAGWLLYRKVLPIAAQHREDKPQDPEGFWLTWLAICVCGAAAFGNLTSAVMWMASPDYHTMSLISRTLGLR